MGSYSFFVGVDVSKATLDFCLARPGGQPLHFKVSNDRAGYSKALRQLSAVPGFTCGSCLLCMEYTGLYLYRAAIFFKQKGVTVWVVNAASIKQGTGTVTRGKDDKVDAARISEFAYRFHDRCTPWEPPREAVRQLAELQAAREQLKRAAHLIRVGTRERRAATGIKGVNERGMEAVLRRITEEIKAVERKSRELIKADPVLARLHKLITSVKGVADITAIAIIVATNEFRKFRTARKFACHAGCAPFPHSSGTSVSGRSKVSHKADKRLKSLLHQCAVAAISSKGDLRDYYLRKQAEGKHKLLVINAVKGKLIQRIYACVRDGRIWTPIPPQPPAKPD